MLSQIARSFLTRVSAKGLLFLVLPCDLPPWVLCTSTSSSFYTVTVLCLFLPSVCPISYFVLYIFSSFRCISFLFIFIFRDVASPFRSLFFLSRVLFHFLHLHILRSFTILPFLLVSFVLLVVSLSSLCSHLHGPLAAISLSSPLFYLPDSLPRFARTCLYTSEREYFVYPVLSQFFEFCGPPFRSFSLPPLSKKP